MKWKHELQKTDSNSLKNVRVNVNNIVHQLEMGDETKILLFFRWSQQEKADRKRTYSINNILLQPLI
jgi:hypothetical protein